MSSFSVPPQIIMRAAIKLETDQLTAAVSVASTLHFTKKRYAGLIAKAKITGRI